MSIDAIISKVENIENSLSNFQKQAVEDIKVAGSMATETKNAIDKLGESQREIADRLLSIEQSGGSKTEAAPITSWGKQFIASNQYDAFRNGSVARAKLEIQNNTSLGSDVTVAPSRKPGVVSGPVAPLGLEDFLPSVPADSNAIEFTKENVYTNAAAESAEGSARAESSLTWTLVNMPISDVGHFVKISKQLANDAPALSAYINQRMSYGVDRRVETQLAIGDGTAPNISGIFDAGNFVAHGYANAALGSTLKKLVLIRKVMGDLWSAGYPADAILLNPADWATIETELLTTAAGQARISYDEAGTPQLFGVAVIPSIGTAAGQFAVGAFRQACVIHNREGVTVELSESDSDNFTKKLVTVRAERRLALATEVPAAIRAGALVPA